VYAALLAGLALWLNAGYYQHTIGGTALVGWTNGLIDVQAFARAERWGRPDAKIPHSPFNAESGRTWEHGYGVRVRVAHVGFEASRRAVAELDKPYVWGVAARDSVGRYSIGYHDGVRPIVWIGPARITGPYVLQWNSGTLPSHTVYVNARWRWVELVLGAGGTRGSVAMDVHVSGRVDWLTYGVAAGWVEPPGWGSDVFRVAATLGMELWDAGSDQASVAGLSR
jgi:hypothetical protein